MAKLPSLQQLQEGFSKTLKRFPLEILVSLIGSGSFIYLIYNRFEERNLSDLLIRLMLVSILALTLFLSASVFIERKNVSRTNGIILRIVAVALTIGLFFFLDPMRSIVNVFRYGFLVVGFHLLVSFAPFHGDRSTRAFWEYNKRLFLRILLSALYSTVLFGGLCIALVCIDQLFDASINERTYGYLAAIVYGMFNTIFFLAGIPADWSELEGNQEYPRGLKIFTQFVLIPLATVYFAILLSYEGKLIVSWSLPKGFVSSLVIGYAVYGILSILLIYPIRKEADNRWIETFSKLFYTLLIPLVALLGVAIFTRVLEYGITEPRYILLVLSFWLAAITLYFLISRSENIKVIPISLCVVALLSVWGPQSATAVSIRSQMNELTNLFDRNGAYQNEKFTILPDTTSSNDFSQADNIIDFLVDREGFQSFRNKTKYDVDSLEKSMSDKDSYLWSNRLGELLGVKNSFLNQRRTNYYAYSKNDTITIRNYDYLLPVNWYVENSQYSWDGKSLLLKFNSVPETTFSLKPIIERMKANKERGRDRMMRDLTVSGSSKETMCLLVFDEISLSSDDDEYVLESFKGYLLIRNQ